MKKAFSLSKRIQSLVVVISFIVTNHFSPPAFAAAGIPQNISGVERTQAGFPSDLSQVQLPEAIGKIQEVYQASSFKPQAAKNV